jgi:DNA repair/transcription protein MET18/MMS19
VKDKVLPMLFSSLPDQAPPREASDERAKYWRTLSALSRLCLQSELFESLIIRLTTKLDLICVPLSKDVDVEPSAAYAHSILKTIADTLASKVDKRHLDVPKYVDRLVPHLYNLFIYSAVVPNAPDMVATDSRLVGIAAQIISLVTETLSPQ